MHIRLSQLLALRLWERPSSLRSPLSSLWDPPSSLWDPPNSLPAPVFETILAVANVSNRVYEMIVYWTLDKDITGIQYPLLLSYSMLPYPILDQNLMQFDFALGEKDGPGPVMVSDTLCSAVHILGT